MTEQHPHVFTIGHSTHPLEAFIALLSEYRVTVVADVRSAPVSRFNPQFNKKSLEQSLKTHGIRYVFLGHELGARSDDPSCYENGRVQYARLAQKDEFKNGLDRVLRGAEEHRIALMCAEKEPLDCHRTLLVARSLVERGAEVDHILSDGRVEPHDETMDRLLRAMGSQPNLFLSREKRIEDALALQEAKVAYVDQDLAAGVARDAS